MCITVPVCSSSFVLLFVLKSITCILVQLGTSSFVVVVVVVVTIVVVEFHTEECSKGRHLCPDEVKDVILFSPYSDVRPAKSKGNSKKGKRHEQIADHASRQWWRQEFGQWKVPFNVNVVVTQGLHLTSNLIEPDLCVNLKCSGLPKWWLEGKIGGVHVSARSR